MIDWEIYIYHWNISDNWWWNNLINCQLCWTEIRYEFEIVNNNNEEDILLIWCECIKKFDIDLYKELQHWKRKFLKNRSTQNVLQALYEFSVIDCKFDYQIMIRFFERHWWFSPHQILVLIEKSKDLDIKISPKDFRVSLKRNKEKTQLHNMNLLNKEKIRTFLSKVQLATFNI